MFLSPFWKKICKKSCKKNNRIWKLQQTGVFLGNVGEMRKRPAKKAAQVVWSCAILPGAALLHSICL